MKRFHVHVSVEKLDESIRFYSAIFGAGPSVVKEDYAKWMLEDPRVNFAVSTRGRAAGIDHLGIQVESAGELEEMRQRLQRAAQPTLEQKSAACCYAKSDKHWTVDPQGIPWEAFHTLADIPVYGGDSAVAEVKEAAAVSPAACCTPRLG